jgi:anthranilate phosphoribosyltransferase
VSPADEAEAVTSDPVAEHGGWPAVIAGLLARRDLAAEVATDAMRSILAGAATPAQIAGFLIALRAKGETAEEVTGLLTAVLEAGSVVPLADELRDRAIDVVGTGGDRSHSVNVSTMAALVTAGAGVPVCKHGNRAASSRCGTADVLEALGVALELSPAGVAHCIEVAGMGFCFAPRFHPAFRHAGPPRRELGVATAFNLLGPMANPGRVRHHLLGVADPLVGDLVASTLQRLGATSAWVVHGDGLDELTTTGVSTVLELRDGERRTFAVDPSDLGLAPASPDQLVGGSPDDNAAVVRRVLGGDAGPHRDIVVLNAGAALVVARRATDLPHGIELARASIDDGAAAAVLDRLVAASQEAAEAER